MLGGIYLDLFTFIIYMYIEYVEHIGSESGGIGGNHKSCLHLTVKSLGEVAAVDALHTSQHLVFNQVYACLEIAEVAQILRQQRAAVLHAA